MFRLIKRLFYAYKHSFQSGYGVKRFVEYFSFSKEVIY